MLARSLSGCGPAALGILLVGCLPWVVGCTMLHARPELPDASNVVRDQLVLHSDFRLPRRHRLLEEVVALRGDVARELDVPLSDEPIHVYLFETARPFRRYIEKHYPDLPDRRAFFVETDTRLAVYAYWGDRVAEDLRHEVTHGYLHAVTPYVPLWLDEGIAEYFESPRGYVGLHVRHVESLTLAAAEDRWVPDLSRMEALASLNDMSPLDYAESWLWVHFLLQTSRERRTLLQQHLALLRDNGQAPPLSGVLRQIEPQAPDALLAHLNTLQGTVAIAAANPD